MISKNLKIEIRPIPEKNDIKEFSKELEFFSQPKTLPCLVNPVTLKYATGLSEEDLEYLKEKDFPYDVSDTWRKGEAHPFWESQMMKVELKNTPIFLYPGRSDVEFCKYKFLLASQYIYSSESEVKSGNKPEATHFIYNEEVAVDVKASRLEAKNELLRKVADLSEQRKRDVLRIILDEDMTTQSVSYMTVKFDEVLNDVKQARELKDLLAQPEAKVSMAAFVKSAITNAVLKKTSQGIFYFDTNLGFSEEDVMEFLNTPENQEIFISIKNKNT